MRRGGKTTSTSRFKGNGYTIVEVMVFLVISGVILATSLLFFRGRQSRIQFTQGVREIESQIKTVMNEVSSGYYPNKGDFSCTDSLNGPILDFDNPGTQGSNEDCIFLGKALTFGTPGEYTAYTILGLRKSSDSISPSLEQSMPVIDQAIKEVNQLPWGIQVEKVVSVNGQTGAKTPIDAIAFVMSLGSFSGTGDVLSGSQAVDLIPLGVSGLQGDFNNLKANVQSMNDGQRRPERIVMCLLSAEGDRKASIVFGGSGKQLNVEVSIDTSLEECNDA